MSQEEDKTIIIKQGMLQMLTIVRPGASAQKSMLFLAESEQIGLLNYPY